MVNPPHPKCTLQVLTFFDNFLINFVILGNSFLLLRLLIFFIFGALFFGLFGFYMHIKVCYVPGPGRVVDFAPNPNWISDLFYVKIAI